MMFMFHILKKYLRDQPLDWTNKGLKHCHFKFCFISVLVNQHTTWAGPKE